MGCLSDAADSGDDEESKMDFTTLADKAIDSSDGKVDSESPCSSSEDSDQPKKRAKGKA